MVAINGLLVLIIAAIVVILLVNVRGKGMFAAAAVVTIAIVSSMVAIPALLGHSFEVMLTGTYTFGAVAIKVDALSAWFILTINFTMTTGIFYGLGYMQRYADQRNSITLHAIAYILLHFALVGLCVIQNAMVFLLFWEMMALSAFVLITFEHVKKDTLRAGINFLIHSHVSIIFLMLGFMYVAFKTGSYSFSAIADFAHHQSAMAGIALFLAFFIGFAIKAGFVPFHTWLPYAHPVAPAHISAVMSGVVIKIGIFGMLRMLLHINSDYTTIGFIILFASILSGIYGVMLAIIQHNLKRLLAYHSIENIGIIGIGMGIGTIGLGIHNEVLAILGFGGALLHVLNHSLFKSLLFYGAGNVYLATHTVAIEKLGGIIKKMPRTAILFLIAALAISGLPPFNGFVSEFLIYSGLYGWIGSGSIGTLVIVLFSLLSLVLIGGLALLCFTKAFSIVFLGNSRHVDVEEVHEQGKLQLIPMYFVGLLMLLIGFFPSQFLRILQQPIALFTQTIGTAPQPIPVNISNALHTIGWAGLLFALLVVALWILRRWVSRNKLVEIGPTWGCAYPTSSAKLQYTANSFARSYSKLAKPMLDIGKKEIAITEVFPSKKHYETHTYDKLERYFIDKLIKLIKVVTGWFLFLQNGRLQRYILYGILFISGVIVIPIIIEKIMMLLHFLNNL